MTSPNTEETRMSDTDLAAAARILHAVADAIDQADDWAPATLVTVHDLASYLQLDPGPDDHAIAAALLAAARREAQREPRVWLPGDTVPAGVWVLDRVGGVYPVGSHYVVDSEFVGPVVEVFVPGHAAAVAAEQARRAADELIVHDAALGLYDGEVGA